MSFKKETGTILELLATVWIQWLLQLAFAVQPTFSKICNLKNGKHFPSQRLGQPFVQSSVATAHLSCPCGQRGNKGGGLQRWGWHPFPPLHKCPVAVWLSHPSHQTGEFVALPLVVNLSVWLILPHGTWANTTQEKPKKSLHTGAWRTPFVET